MVVDGGLSVEAALGSDATGVVAVRGHLFDDGTGLRLCEGLVSLGERFDYFGERIEVNNLDVETVPDVVFLEGTTFTDDETTR